MEYFIGILVSLLIQWLNKHLKMGEWGTLVVLAFVALMAAVFYTWLVSAGYWENLQAILVTAGAFHNFVLRRFETK